MAVFFVPLARRSVNCGPVPWALCRGFHVVAPFGSSRQRKAWALPNVSPAVDRGPWSIYRRDWVAVRGPWVVDKSARCTSPRIGKKTRRDAGCAGAVDMWTTANRGCG